MANFEKAIKWLEEGKGIKRTNWRIDGEVHLILKEENGKKLKNLTQKLISYRINPYGLMTKHADLSNSKWKKYYEMKGEKENV